MRVPNRQTQTGYEGRRVGCHTQVGTPGNRALDDPALPSATHKTVKQDPGCGRFQSTGRIKISQPHPIADQCVVIGPELDGAFDTVDLVEALVLDIDA